MHHVLCKILAKFHWNPLSTAKVMIHNIAKKLWTLTLSVWHFFRYWIFSMHFYKTVHVAILITHLFDFPVLWAAWKCKIYVLSPLPIQFIMLSSAALGWNSSTLKKERFLSEWISFLARLYEVQGELLQSPRSSASVSGHTVTKFYMQVFQKFISWQPLIRKHSYLDHRYPGGPAFILWLLSPGLMPRVGLEVKI